MKAILVIDMPSDCNHCQFADFSNCQWECNQHKGGRISESMKICSTPSWCPLKPLPKLLEEEIDMGLNPSDDSPAMHYKRGLCHGWRGCLNNILGDNDET